MKLSIIIPVFNEERTIEQVLRKITEVKLAGIEKEIIVVNDASTDATLSIISKFFNQQNRNNVRIFTHEKNQGKGSAVRTGIKEATGKYILIQDADLEYAPTDIVYLIEPIRKRSSLVVYGTRLRRLPNLRRDEKTVRFLFHYIGNRLLSLLTSILYGQWITDMETGYKLFPRRALKNLTLHSKSFDFEPEITAKLLKAGFRVLEIPISTNPRGYDEGKKLNTFRDGIVALWTLVKYRFTD